MKLLLKSPVDLMSMDSVHLKSHLKWSKVEYLCCM